MRNLDRRSDRFVAWHVRVSTHTSDRLVSHRDRFSSPYASGVRDARHTRGRANGTPRLGASAGRAPETGAERAVNERVRRAFSRSTWWALRFFLGRRASSARLTTGRRAWRERGGARCPFPPHRPVRVGGGATHLRNASSPPRTSRSSAPSRSKRACRRSSPRIGNGTGCRWGAMVRCARCAATPATTRTCARTVPRRASASASTWTTTASPPACPLSWRRSPP